MPLFVSVSPSYFLSPCHRSVCHSSPVLMSCPGLCLRLRVSCVSVNIRPDGAQLFLLVCCILCSQIHTNYSNNNTWWGQVSPGSTISRLANHSCTEQGTEQGENGQESAIRSSAEKKKQNKKKQRGKSHHKRKERGEEQPNYMQPCNWQ